MSDHTPGPWRLAGPDTSGDYTIQPPDEPMAIAAITNGEMMRTGGKAREHAANAHIVAAAPELLTALQAIMEAHGPGTLASHEIYLNACNALAKAEGREP